jgi:membrane protein
MKTARTPEIHRVSFSVTLRKARKVGRPFVMERIGSPYDMTLRAWWHALRDAVKSYASNNLGDRAATLTYYSVLAIFPALIVLISLLGVLGDQGTVDGLLRIVDNLGPSSAGDTLRGPLDQIVEHSSRAGVALIFGAALALWSASGYIGAFIWASNEIWGVEDDERPFWKLRPLQVLITLAMVGLVAALLFALVLSGPLADAVGDELGIGDTALKIWSIAKWPLLFLVVVFAIALLFRVSPDAHHQGLRWLLPGSALATVLWLVASAGFSAYVSNFGSYSNTYGSLAGVIVFLIWLWLSNSAILLGAQFAAELERTGAAATAPDYAPTDTVPIEPAERAQPAEVASTSTRGAADERA